MDNNWRREGRERKKNREEKGKGETGLLMLAVLVSGRFQGLFLKMPCLQVGLLHQLVGQGQELLTGKRKVKKMVVYLSQ